MVLSLQGEHIFIFVSPSSFRRRLFDGHLDGWAILLLFRWTLRHPLDPPCIFVDLR